MSEPAITVLHVDDDEVFSELVATFVRRRYDDIAVRTARTGAEALSHLEATADVDCVVSDYEMPGLNGLELLESVRECWPDLPFVLFTGQGSEEIAVRALNAGVTDYLQKRPDTSAYTLLVNRIRNAVAQRRAEAELDRASRRTEAQLKLLVDTVEDYAIFLLDEDGYVRTWNGGAERIKGYTSEEAVGEHFSLFYREEDVEAGVPERNLREAATEGHVRDEGWRVRKDGTVFWADVTITALREGGDLVGYAKITRDDTRHHRARVPTGPNERERSDELVAAISHDLADPLAVAEASVEAAAETGDLSRLETARAAHERAADLLDHLETLVGPRGPVVTFEPVDLREASTAAWRSVGPDGATLTVEGDTTIEADGTRLRRLLENLFRNCVEHGSTCSRVEPDDAVEHGGPGVAVTVGPLDDGTGFYVEDDGPGIPEAERSRVFEAGYSGERGGTGFGLAVCRQVAGVHGWTIDVTDGPAGGARFEVTGVGVS